MTSAIQKTLVRLALLLLGHCGSNTVSQRLPLTARCDESALCDEGTVCAQAQCVAKEEAALVAVIPSDLQASSGDHSRFVRLSWSGVSGAAAYIVYRDSEPIGRTTTTTLDDIGAGAPGALQAPSAFGATDSSRSDGIGLSWSSPAPSLGSVHLYRVAVVTENGLLGDQSEIASGFRAEKTLGFEWSSDGVIFNPVAGTGLVDTSAPQETQVWPANAVAQASPLGDSAELFVTAAYVEAPLPKPYWVRAVGETSTSPRSGPVVGRRARSGIDADDFSYQWERSSADSNANYAPIAGAARRAHEDAAYDGARHFRVVITGPNETRTLTAGRVERNRFVKIGGAGGLFDASGRACGLDVLGSLTCRCNSNNVGMCGIDGTNIVSFDATWNYAWTADGTELPQMHFGFGSTVFTNTKVLKAPTDSLCVLCAGATSGATGPTDPLDACYGKPRGDLACQDAFDENANSITEELTDAGPFGSVLVSAFVVTNGGGGGTVYIGVRADDGTIIVVSPDGYTGPLIDDVPIEPVSELFPSEGDEYACALHQDNHIRCWGVSPSNGGPIDLAPEYSAAELVGGIGCGVLGSSGAMSCNSPSGNPPIDTKDWIDATSNGCGLHSDGRMRCWNAANPDTHDGLVYGVKSVRDGRGDFCVQMEDDSMRCFPANLGGPTGPVRAIGSRSEHSGVCFIPLAGDRVKCGASTYLTNVVPASPFVALSTGCALREDHSAVCVGTTIPPEAQFIAISGSGGNACGIAPDGSLHCYGKESAFMSEMPATGSYVSISMGINHACAIKTDGTLACWGQAAFTDVWTNTPGGKYTRVSSDVGRSCAVREDGAVVCFDETGSVTETAPSEGRFKDVTVGAHHECLVGTDGRVQCRGANDFLPHFPHLAP